jgi:AcrR family transcriptional regulator
MESPTRRSQDQRRGEAEQRMLDAGVRLLALNGPEKLTLTEVGKSAGYSRGLPAHHFGSREQFLKALASHVAIEFDRTLTGVDRARGLVATIEITRASLVQLKENPTRGLATHIVMSDPRQEQALSIEIAGLRDETLSLLASHIADGIRDGEIRRDVAPGFVALFIASGICGIIDSWLADPSLDVEKAGEQLLCLIENGLAARSREPT